MYITNGETYLRFDNIDELKKSLSAAEEGIDSEDRETGEEKPSRASRPEKASKAVNTEKPAHTATQKHRFSKQSISRRNTRENRRTGMRPPAFLPS